MDSDAVQNYRRLVEDSGVALFQTGTDGSIRWVNPAAARIVGYDSPEDFVQSVRDIREIYVDPSRRDELLRVMEERGRVSGFEYEMRRKDGAIRWISLSARSLPASGDMGPGFEGIFTDVTDRKLLEAALQAVSAHLDPAEAISRFASVLERVIPFEQLTLAVIEGDRYRRMVSISPSGRADSFPLDEKVPLADNPMKQVVSSRKPVVHMDTSRTRFEFDRFLKESGIASYAMLPLIDDRGSVFATFNVGAGEPRMFDEDIVALLESLAGAVANAVKNILLFEREREANRQLAELDRLRRDLLAWVSHDLRSPLAVIKGSAAIVVDFWDRVSDEDKKERLAVIVRQADRMDSLLRRDLDLALMESGELECEKEPFDLAELVRRTVDDMEKADTEHTFKAEISESLPQALGDAERTLQVLGNLLSNAVKFSPETSVITLRVSAQDDVVSVDVHNEGEGIERLKLQEIFRKMSRLDPAREGTGLGLYISKYLIEVQGGEIRASSAPGEGVTFTFTLPATDLARESESGSPA